jgi:hypothetical protein
MVRLLVLLLVVALVAERGVQMSKGQLLADPPTHRPPG